MYTLVATLLSGHREAVNQLFQVVPINLLHRSLYSHKAPSGKKRDLYSYLYYLDWKTKVCIVIGVMFRLASPSTALETSQWWAPCWLGVNSFVHFLLASSLWFLRPLSLEDSSSCCCLLCWLFLPYLYLQILMETQIGVNNYPNILQFWNYVCKWSYVYNPLGNIPS